MDISKVHNFRFKNLQKAWQGLNEHMLGGYDQEGNPIGWMDGNQYFLDNVFVHIDKAEMDPDYDLGEGLGYAPQKWNSLVKNYVEPGYLDLLRTHITRERIGKKKRVYNDTMHFTNHFASGKDCLISVTLSKKKYDDKPVALFHIRTSEITKRLPFDFLLVQRIVEHIYGHNDVYVQLFAPMIHITTTSITMMENTKRIPKILKRFGIDSVNRMSPFQRKMYDEYKFFMKHPDPEQIKYRVSRRACMQIQKGEDGKPLSGVKSMKVKDLHLETYEEELPDEVISRSQIRKHKKNKA